MAPWNGRLAPPPARSAPGRPGRAPRAILALALLASLASAAVRAAEEGPGDPGEALRRSIDGLRSRFFADREAAVRALVEIGRKDPSAGPALIPLLDDPEDRVRILVLHVLGEIRYGPALQRIAEIVADPSRPNLMEREALIGALVKFGREAEEALFKAGADRQPLGQRVLGRIALEDVLAYIQEFYKDPDDAPGWYEGQFDGLKPRGRPAVFAMMLIAETYFTAEPSWFKGRTASRFRWHALFALGEFGDPVALPLLRRVVRDVGEAIRTKPEGGQEDSALDPERTAAVACWKLGDRDPLQKRIEAMRRSIEEKRKSQRMDSQIATEISTCYWDLAILLSPLNQVEEVVEAYKKYMWWRGRAGRPAREYSVAQYNIACAYAKVGEARKGLEEFVRAVDMGYSEIRWSQKDGDLAPVHALPEFNFALAYAHLRRIVDEDLQDEGRAENLRNAVLQVRLGLERGASDPSWFASGKLEGLRDEPEYHWNAARCHARAGQAAECAARIARYAEAAREAGGERVHLAEIAGSDDFAKVKDDPAVKAAIEAARK